MLTSSVLMNFTFDTLLPRSEIIEIACKPRPTLMTQRMGFPRRPNNYSSRWSSSHRRFANRSKLASRIDECGNSIIYMEKRLNTIVHQMDNMEERLDSMKDLLSGLDLKLNTVDGYLLEIVKREKDIMLEFRDLSRK